MIGTITINPWAWAAPLSGSGYNAPVADPATAAAYIGIGKPVLRPAPAAPQTAQEMLAWNPDMLLKADRENWAEWAKNPLPDVPSLDNLFGLLPTMTDVQKALWITAGIAVVAMVIVLKVK